MSASAMPGEGGRQHYGFTLAVLVLAALAFALSQTLIAPALPEIQRIEATGPQSCDASALVMVHAASRLALPRSLALLT